MRNHPKPPRCAAGSVIGLRHWAGGPGPGRASRSQPGLAEHGAPPASALVLPVHKETFLVKVTLHLLSLKTTRSQLFTTRLPGHGFISFLNSTPSLSLLAVFPSKRSLRV